MQPTCLCIPAYVLTQVPCQVSQSTSHEHHAMPGYLGFCVGNLYNGFCVGNLHKFTRRTHAELREPHTPAPAKDGLSEVPCRSARCGSLRCRALLRCLPAHGKGSAGLYLPHL